MELAQEEAQAAVTLLTSWVEKTIGLSEAIFDIVNLLRRNDTPILESTPVE